MNISQLPHALPLISVIIPAYNAEAFIAETLQSVIAQTYQNIEILVVDDGSQDQTARIVQSFAETDPRVTLFQQPNRGVAAARNLAIEKSQGEYIAPIDADDIWYPQKLEKQLQLLLASEPHVGLVYAWSAFIDEQGVLTGRLQAASKEGEVYVALLAGNFIGNASAPLIRRACLKTIGGYNTQMREQNAQGCEDWDLYLRIAEQYQFRVISEFLIGYRQSTSSMSCNCTAMAKSYDLMLADAQRRSPEIPAKLLRLSAVKYYLYLVNQSIRDGNHYRTLLLRAIRLDLALLLSDSLYSRLLITTLKLIFQPIASLFWPNHHAWVAFKQRHKSKQSLHTFAELDARARITRPVPQNLYNRIWLQRWNQVASTYKLNSKINAEI
jgi:glycosyltransferase involved in cell wall biosynthesis